jgi:hypothetical protein
MSAILVEFILQIADHRPFRQEPTQVKRRRVIPSQNFVKNWALLPIHPTMYALYVADTVLGSALVPIEDHEAYSQSAVVSPE